MCRGTWAGPFGSGIAKNDWKGHTAVLTTDGATVTLDGTTFTADGATMVGVSGSEAHVASEYQKKHVTTEY